MREGLVSESDLNSHACDLRHLPIYSALEQEIAGQRHVVCGVWCVSEGGLEHANPGNFPGSGKSCRQDTRPLTPVNHLPSMASAGLSALSACLRGTGPECPAP